MLISNSKSPRFSSFFMPNNFGTGQKKAFFRLFRKVNHIQIPKNTNKLAIQGNQNLKCSHCELTQKSFLHWYYHLKWYYHFKCSRTYLWRKVTRYIVKTTLCKIKNGTHWKNVTRCFARATKCKPQ